MANIESRWTIQGVAQLVALTATLVSLIVLAYNSGQAWGNVSTRLIALEEKAEVSASDSRTLIRVEERLAGIERSLIQLRSIAATGSISCPDSQPVLVASYCRAAPISSSSQDR